MGLAQDAAANDATGAAANDATGAAANDATGAAAKDSPTKAVAAETRYQGAQPAPTYFAVHRQKIFAAIRAHLTAAAWPAPHARLGWAMHGGARASAFEAALLDACGGVFNLAGKIPELLYPADPWQLIDAHRELEDEDTGEEAGDGEPRKGSLTWSPIIGAALALEVEAQLRASTPRLGRRYVAQAESAGSGAVTVEMLVTSHPFDRIVARLLCAPGIVQRERGKGRASRDTDSPDAFKEGLRLVHFEWQGALDPALWNWVRVTEPADARKEEVAMAVLERQDGELHTELAYALTGSPPFFQIPPRWARDLEGARRFAPAPGADAGTSAAEQRSALALADSPLADAVAQAEVSRYREARFTASGHVGDQASDVPKLASLLERSGAQLYEVLGRLGPWHLHALVGPALRWVQRRRETLWSEPDATLARWAPIIEEQQALLFEATGEISEVLATSSPLEPAATSSQAQPARAVLEAYALAMGESHLVESARAQLQVARRARAELPLRMIELSLRESRATAHEAVAASAINASASSKPPAAAGAAGAAGAAAPADPRLAAQQGMELGVLAHRQAQASGAPIDPHAVDALACAAAESAHRNRISALDDRLAALQREVDRAGDDGAVSALANLFHGELRELPDTLRRVRRAARQTVERMDQRTHAWLTAHAAEAARGDQAASRRFSEALLMERRENLRRAQRELAELAEREQLQTLFQRALDTLKDAALYTLIFETALLIGVAVVGSFAGAAVGGLVRGAMLANAAVDSAAFYRGALLARGAGALANLGADAAVNALAQTALSDGEESTARAFSVNLLSSAAVISALRPLQAATRRWTALEDQAQKLWTLAGGKRVLVHGLSLGAEMITGAAVSYAVERAVPRAKSGKPPSEAETSSWLIQGAAMAVGRFVAGRLHQLQERLGALAEGAVHLRKRAATSAALARRVEDGGDAGAALRLVDEHTRLLLDEAELLHGRAIAASGLDAQQLATLREGNATARGEAASSSMGALRLSFAGLEPLSGSGALWSGTRPQIEEAIAAAGPAARNPHRDPLRRRWTVELGGQEVVLVEVERGGAGGARLRSAEGAEPAAIDPREVELTRIRNGPPGRIRPAAELDDGDVAMAMNAQLRAISADEVQDILGHFPPAQREQARYVLARSSQFGTLEAWSSLRQALAPYMRRGLTLYAPGRGSLADNLTYTAVKRSYASGSGVPAPLAITRTFHPRSVVLLDEVILHQLRTDPKLAQDLVTHGCTLLEPRGFQAGINLHNSSSPEAVTARTEAVLQRALALSAGGKLPFEQAVDVALGEGTRAQLDAIHPALSGQLKEVDAAAHPELSNAAISKQLSGEAGITEAELGSAMARVPSALRGHAREVLARQSEIFSSRRFAAELADQHHKLLARAAERGVPEAKVFFYIPQRAKSYGMIAMAHRQATSTPVARYVDGLDDLRARKLGDDTALIIFDDVAGSGESLRDAAVALGDKYEGAVIVSPMISTEAAQKLFTAPKYGVSAGYPNIEYLPRTQSKALKESGLHQGLGAGDRKRLLSTVGDPGYGDNALSVAFPYMAPDNNNALFGDLIAKYFILNRNARASKAAPYKPPSTSGK